jgi:bla regulator protein BlaR1
MNDFSHVLRSLFESILTTSWQASLIVAAILISSWLVRNRLSCRVRHGLWLILLFKLMIPFAPASSLSLFNWVPEKAASPIVIVQEKPMTVTEESFIASSSEIVGPPVMPVDFSSNRSDDLDTGSKVAQQPVSHAPQPSRWQTWLAVAWLVGCFFFLIQMIYQNLIFALKIRGNGVDCDTSVNALLEQQVERLELKGVPTLVESKSVSTPAVHGLIKPVIILPLGMAEKLTEDQMRHVFLHELAHIKRRDLLVNWLAHVMRAVHWFNPVIWFAVARMRTDCELATDALALKQVGEGNRHEYGETILHLLKRVNEHHRLPGLVGIVEGKKEMARRLISIRDFRRKPKFSLVAFGAIVLLSISSLTKAVSKPDNVSPSAETSSGEVELVTSDTPVVESVDITVVDPDGNPVPDAEVALGERAWWFMDQGKTDEQGRFRVSKGSFKPDLVLRGAGFAPTLLNFDYDISLTNRIYQLEKAATIEGVVVDPDGDPIKDAEVIPSDWYRFGSFGIRIKTDDEGRFVWNEAPNHGKIEFTVFAKGYKSVRDYLIPVDSQPRIQMSKPDKFIGTVVDADTGEAIPSFKFELGEKQRADGRVANIRRKGDGTGGSFEVNVTEPARPFHVVTVYADGYAPYESPNFRDGDGVVEFRFELEKETFFNLSVVRPDGRPASHATWVQAIKNDQEVWISETKQVDLDRIRDKSRIGKFDENGQAQIRPVVGMSGLVITHAEGYAEMGLHALQSATNIELYSWGRVEGYLYSGPEPVVDQLVKIGRMDVEFSLVFHSTRTDSDGRFIFQYLPAGEYRLHRESGSNLAWIDVVAGETSTATVGKDGRTIVGHAKVDIPSIEEVNWHREEYYLETELPVPANIKNPTDEERQSKGDGIQRYFARKRAFWDSAEGKAIKRTERKYAIKFNHDGTFRIEGVVPGRYTLSLHLHHREVTSSNSTMSKSIAYANQTVVVPSTEEGGLLNKVIDLGVIQLLPSGRILSATDKNIKLSK